MTSSGARFVLSAPSAAKAPSNRRPDKRIRIVPLSSTDAPARGAVSLQPAAKQLLGDRDQLDVARSLVDPADLRIAVQLLHRILPGHANSAKNLDGLRGHLLGHLGTIILRH